MSDDYFNWRANSFKPKKSYPDSKMRVWNKPEKEKPKDAADQSMEVDENPDASPSMIERIIAPFRR